MVFLLLSYGVNGFSILESRQGLQRGALLARTRLLRDLELSHFDSVTVLPGAGAKRRDTVGFLGLSSWSDPAKYSVEGFSQWDRKVVYYVKEDGAGALLRRAELAPPFPAGYDFYPAIPLTPALLGGARDEDGSAAYNPKRQETVIAQVDEFICEVDASRQLVELTLRFQQVAGRRIAGAGRATESFQAVFDIDPRNTVPRQ